MDDKTNTAAAAADTKTGTDVAVQGAAAGGVPAVYDYGNYAGAGFEGTTAADFKPSFLRILHGNSPQLDTVKDAKTGLICDSVTNDLYSEILFVPAVREHVMAAWKPRSAEGGGGGSGFGGIYQMTDPVVVAALKTIKKFERNADGKIILPEINGGEFQLVETVYFHGVQALAEGAYIPATLSFYSTGLPVAADWYTTMRRQLIPGGGNPFPLFAHVSKLGVVKSERGTFKWYNFSPSWANATAVASRLSPDSELFKAGAAVYDAFKAGTTNVDYAQGGADNGAANSDSKTGSKDIPF